ncbi:Pr6Pr family membrane protein [Celeribacter arenosi]|uniref:Pr6Pr family membrane protein n=1 Tax=Celeribacter arenosi TaxID=792649 RepID=UPI0031D0B6A1
MSRLALAFAALISLLGAIAFAASFAKHAISGEHGGPIGILWHQLKYFTLWTNVLVMVLFARMSSTGRFLGDSWLAALTLWMLIVMAVFHLLLGNDEPQRGLSWVSDTLFHTINPLLLALWWTICAPKSELRWRHAAVWLLWPLVYVIYAVTRGALTGFYPYFFVNLAELGWGGLMAWVMKFLIAFYVAGVLVVAIGRVISRTAPVRREDYVPDDLRPL